MRTASFLFAFGIPALFCPSPAAPQSTDAPLRYTLSYPQPGADLVQVRIDWDATAPGPRTVVMPRAIPMGYANVPYDRYVENVRAFTASGGTAPVASDANVALPSSWLEISRWSAFPSPTKYPRYGRALR